MVQLHCGGCNTLMDMGEEFEWGGGSIKKYKDGTAVVKIICGEVKDGYSKCMGE